MDSKRFNIYAGSALGALLLFLLLNFFSDLIYHGPGHAGDEEQVLAFAVPVEAPEAGAEETAPDWATLVAQADTSNGASVFNKCKACHALEAGDHGVGPSLHNVVGSDIATAEGFSYSSALTGLEGEWTLEALAGFLENPQGYAPGTKMGFAGIGDIQDRVDVIAYLNEASDSPVELAPEATAATSETATDAAAETAEGTDAAESAEDAESAEAAEDGGTETAAATGESAEEPAEEPAASETGEAAETGETGEAAAFDGGGAFADLLANASAENGEKVYRKCQACHTLEEGKHRVGPSLWRVVGSDIGSADGFNYSDAMASFEGDWTLSNLDAYLESPREFIPGNRMSFPGLRDAQDRIDVITYINEAGGSPVELAPEDAAADDSAAAEPASDTTDESQTEAEESEAATETAATEDAGEDAGAFADLLANASAEDGEKVFRKCQACHTLDEGTHRVGPSLHGVIGRDIGSADGFNYSDAMASFEGDWTLENLMGYLESPNEFVPGNKMTFPGLKDAQDRINVFTFIDQADGERDLPE